MSCNHFSYCIKIYRKLWKSIGIKYKWSLNEWSDFMITIDELGNLKSHGVILSDLN
ncbi:hypothetical protein KQI38_08910 [Tissierella carlieri]|nr:hypothetical protein [Tissierella carlieri]